MLGDIQAEIVAFVNEALVESYSAAQLLTAINLTLRELSSANILEHTAPESITAGDQSFDEPDDFKDEVTIYFNDGTVDLAPLRAFSGGVEEYRRAIKWRVDSDRGNPSHYAHFEKTFFIFPAANQDYTANIVFYRFHPADDGKNILFDEDAKNGILYGTTFHKTLLTKKTEYMAIWGPQFLTQKELLRLGHPGEPAIT